MWADRAGHDRTPSVPGHELSGVVVERGYGTTGLTVGQRVFGLSDWTRNGSLAEYTAVEARNLAPLPADIDHTVAAALPISGLAAWQGLFDHARLTTRQTVLIHGAAGGVGSIAVQLARDVGARIIGTGRAPDRDTALGLRRGCLPGPASRPPGRRGRGRHGVRRHRRRHPRPLDRARARRRHARHHRRPARKSCPRTDGPSSSSSNPTVPGLRTSPIDSGTGGSSRSSGPYGHCRKRPPRSPRPAHPRQDDHPGHRRLKGEQS
jgi:Alcohol dehydrogenase GroES-like domain